MAEDLLKKYTFAVDSIKATNGKPMTIAFSQGDVKTAILIINLTENDTALDLTGKKVRVSFKKSDGTSVMQDMTTGISFLDAAAGKIQIELSTQTLSAKGNVRGQISISDEVAGLVAETAEFTFVVRESIVNTSIISTDELPIIEQTIEAAKVLESVDLQTIVNNTSNVTSLKSEVETARGASANLAGRFSNVESSLAQIAANVKSFGAKGDGTTNDSASFQAANDYLVSKGGGVLYAPTGTYITNFILDSNIILKGAGLGNTILKSASTSNKDVIQGRNFDILEGNSTATESEGVRFIQILDLTVDGNKANNTSGYGIRLWGCYWYWENVFVQNCANDGIYTEFSTIVGVTPTNFRNQLLETMFRNIKTSHNNGNGWTYNGPHDSIIDNYVAVKNGGWALYQGNAYSFLTGENWNAWLNGNGFYIGTGLGGHDIVADNDYTGVGIEFGTNSGNSRIANARILGFHNGVVLRGESNKVDVVIADCGNQSDGSALVLEGTSMNIIDLISSLNNRVIDVISEISASVITIRGQVPDGKSLYRGTFRSDDYLNINCGGAAQGSFVQFADTKIKSRGWTMDLPLANGTILTDSMEPTTTTRAGVLKQSAIADFVATDIDWLRSDINGLLSKLRAAGIISY
jgi:hypothetical protein